MIALSDKCIANPFLKVCNQINSSIWQSAPVLHRVDRYPCHQTFLLMLNLNFLCSSWRPFPIALFSVDMGNQILLSALKLPFMYFKIVISLLPRLNNLHTIFSHRSCFFFSSFPLLSSGFSPANLPSLQNTVLTLDKISQLRSLQCYTEWKDYFIHPTSCIPLFIN